MKPQNLLITGGTLSVLIGLLHFIIIFAGPEAYLYFGAGSEMADGDAAGSLLPDVITFFIALAFITFGGYAFSGAGYINRWPGVKGVLVLVSAIFLLRGIAVSLDIAQYLSSTEYPFRNIIFSLVSLSTGVFYALGTYRSFFTTPIKNPE